MPDYAATLRAKSSPDEVASRVKRIRTLYGQYGTWIQKYRGGMPAGFATAIMQWESDGKMSSVGDPGLGEVGFYQITSSFPPKVGIPAEARTIPEMNVFLGMLEYQIEAIRMLLAEPLVELGTPDSWKLARLAFAVGSGGTKSLIRAAAPTTKGKVFAAVRDYVDRTGGMALGSQSAQLVWYRVHAVDLQWQAGQDAVPGGWGPPTFPPQPPNYTYTVAPDLVPYFRAAGAATAVMALGVALVAFLMRR